MKHHQGFSIVEVLASLLLVTSVALSLAQHQLQNRQILNRLMMQIHDRYSYDLRDELAWVKKALVWIQQNKIDHLHHRPGINQ